MKPLTPGQATALYMLIQGRALGEPVRASKESTDVDYDGRLSKFFLSVNSRAAKALVALGYARKRNVLIDGTEVTGADLVHRLGDWETKYEVTARGKRAWEHASARERYGMCERATMRACSTCNGGGEIATEPGSYDSGRIECPECRSDS